jgi:hypothetical protein
MTTTWICWLFGYVTHVRIYNDATQKFTPAQVRARCCCWQDQSEFGEEKDPTSTEAAALGMQSYV